MRLVIDASRALSGGGIEHLRNFAKYLNASNYKKRPLVLCFDSQKHFFDANLFNIITFRNKRSSVLFQMFILPLLCVIRRSILINLDASSFNLYPASITISRDAQSFHSNVIAMYPWFSYLRFRLIVIKYIQIWQLRRSKNSIFLTEGHKVLLQDYIYTSKTIN